MKDYIIPKTDSEETGATHSSNCPCSLCGKRYHSIAFKGGYVCEACVDYVKGLT